MGPFYQHFSTTIQILRKFRFAVIPLLAIISQKTLAYATTAELSCHMQSLCRCNDTNWLPLQSNSPVTLQWIRVMIKWLPSHIVTILVRCKLTPYNEMTPIDPVLQYAQSLLTKAYTLLTAGEVWLLLWTQIEIFHDDVIKWKHFPRYWPFVRGIHRSRWLPHTKASDAELWCFLWSGHEQTVE